ncbi:hypothetical protein [Enterovirga sp.]|uniref:hypothetical protein n=1 Tax=Enterovirga sp. TaxID=2026350 RepID=UPI002BD7F448|nr:hypothetical protein [Enterovirga sp.]HMO29073.1 hypothetical protein [Enterovirga sp.]
MARSAGISPSSTAAVLWLMILLVFLPIGIGHVLASRLAQPESPSGASHQESQPRAG